MLFTFEALKGVVVFPQSLIMSLFLKIDHNVNPAKSNALQS